MQLNYLNVAAKPAAADVLLSRRSNVDGKHHRINDQFAAAFDPASAGEGDTHADRSSTLARPGPRIMAPWRACW